MRTKITIALYASLFLGAVFLTGGYALAKSLLGILSVLVMAVCWLIARKFVWPWLNSTLLAGYLCAAAGGTLLGISAHLMIAGSAFALTAWELAGQNSGPAQISSSPWNEILRQRSLKLLALAVGLGLLVAEILLFVRTPIPFGVLLFAGLLGMISLFLFFRLTKVFRG